MERSETATPQWVTREGLTAALDLGRVQGLLVGSVLGPTVPMSTVDMTGAQERTQKGLLAAGLRSDDRIVVCLSNDGDLLGARFAMAAAEISAAASALGPRGRMRLLQSIEAIRATAMISTPTGAMDFLARLHLEFLSDPLDLELRLLVLTGEIAEPATYRHLANEFGAEVVAVYTDPVCGLPLGIWQSASSEAGMLLPDDEIVSLADVVRDESVHDRNEGLAEIVVGHRWHSQLGSFMVRTGQLVTLEGPGVPLPTHTVGEQILIRGVWLPLELLERALYKIDGVAWWELVVERQGTLDAATLHVTFKRASLIGNPMWKGRLEEALASVTPIHVEVVVEPEVAEGSRPPTIADRRGHHLAVDRLSL
jgi:hypothetical protein